MLLIQTIHCWELSSVYLNIHHRLSHVRLSAAAYYMDIQYSCYRFLSNEVSVPARYFRWRHSAHCDIVWTVYIPLRSKYSYLSNRDIVNLSPTRWLMYIVLQFLFFRKKNKSLYGWRSLAGLICGATEDCTDVYRIMVAKFMTAIWYSWLLYTSSLQWKVRRVGWIEAMLMQQRTKSPRR